MFDRVFQPAIPNDYTTTAADKLNYVLDTLRDLIPYTFTYRFTDVDQLQNTLFVQVDVVSYILNRQKYVLQRKMVTEYQQDSSVENLVGMPQFYWFDESTQTITIYPLPSNPSYTFMVQGRKALGPLELDDELPDNMPPFMQFYIVYQIAYLMTQEFGTMWSPAKEAQRVNYENQLKNKRVIDLRPQAYTMFPSNENNVPGFPYFYYLSGGS